MKHRILKIAAIVTAMIVLFFGLGLAFLPLPGTVPVLMYHFIGSAQDARQEKNFVSRESFSGQMDFLKNLGFRVISMDEFYEIYTGRRKPRGKEIVITFDDGNTSFEKEAFPVLKAHGFPATIFLVSESVRAETNGSMSAATVKALLQSGLVTVGGHTATHPSLISMEEKQIRRELFESKWGFEEMLARPIQYVAYPLGDVDPRVVEVARDAGYRLGFSTAYKKLEKTGEGPYAITRIKVTRTADNPVVFWVEVSGLYEGFKRWRFKFKKLFA